MALVRRSLPVAEALTAVRPGMPARRTVIHRAAAAIGPAAPPPAATTGDWDDDGLAGRREWQRVERHGLGGAHRKEAETEGNGRSSKAFHGLFLSSTFLTTGQFVP